MGATMRKKKDPVDIIKRVVRKIATQDVTGGKRSEKALRQSEERYRATMMSVGDGVIATDTERRVEFMNPVAEALTGWRQEEARGEPLDKVFCIINEETRQKVENPARRAMREDLVVGLANHSVLIAKDGSERPIADSAAPIRGEKGEITGVVLVFRDQTQERTAQRALAESERKFRETLKYLDEGYYSCTLEGRILEHNMAFNRILGVDLARNSVGDQLPDFWQNPDERREYLNELMTRGSIRNYLIKAKKIDGEKIVVMANSHLVKGEEDGLARIDGTFTDFTERMRMEEQLRERMKELQALFGLSEIAEREDIALENLYQELANILPISWKYAEIACARIVIGDSEFRTKNFAESTWMQSAPVKVNETAVGRIDVGYLEERPDQEVGPFLKEERRLIDAIAGRLGHITARKRAEDALRESESKFKRLYDSNIIGVIYWDTAGNIIQANGEFLRIVGYTEDDVLSGRARWKDMTPLEYAYLDEKAIKEMTETGISAPFEKEYIRKDGRRVPIRLNAAFLKGERDIGICFIQDITERKRAEEALQEAKDNLERRVMERTRELARSKQLLDETGRLARVGGWEIDLKSNVLSWTDMVYQIHEVDKEYQPAVETGIGFYAPEAVPVISEAVRRAIEDGQSFDVELPLISAKNNKLWVRTAGEAYRENGKIVKIGGVFQDITARKLAEIEARKKSEQLQLLSAELEIIIDSIPGLVFYKDTNNRLIRVNKYMSDAYHMPKERLEGTNLNDLHTREQARAYYEDDLQVIRSRRSKLNIDEVWETETGIRWVNTSKIPHVDETGEVVGVIGVSMDVTERKLAEEELKKHREHLEELVKERTEKLAAAVENLERSNKELEQFAYVASHDLQEPLRMVSSYTQLLAQRYENQLDDKAKKYIQYAVDGAIRMQRLINDLLSYSRVGTRGKPFEATDIHACLGEAVKNLQAAIEENQAMISNDDLPTLRADASQIVMLFQNLLGNAIKFRGASPPRVHVSARERGPEWLFSISDNGIGIDPQYKDRLFVIFQRLHTRQEYPGTGIGLALSKRILERHGGKIWFESEPGKGATFFFTFPK
jgi:PAS domain S-box-containing protein